MEVLGFFAKQDRHSIEELENMFKVNDEYVYFIEHKKTKEWLSLDSEQEKYTRDPLLAKRFRSEVSALTYAIGNNLLLQHEITEHQFLNHP